MFRSEAIFEPKPIYPSCHAATLVELPDGQLLAAWFAGTHEGHLDVAIWLARFDGDRWSDPIKIIDEPGVPLWNPVLFRDATETVWLFYKIGPTIPAWTGMYVKSSDGGQTWSSPCSLPAGLLGPAKNKPITLSNGEILCGTSSESWRSWSCWVEISGDGGKTWSKHGPITAPYAPAYASGPDTVTSAVWDDSAHELVLPQKHCGVIQPTVWEYAPGHIKMLMRATQRVGFVCVAYSEDYGRSWSPASVTDIPCPNSGLDAVRLADGRIMLACNPIPMPQGESLRPHVIPCADGRIVLACNPIVPGRSTLSLLMSEDNGATWPWRKDLESEPGEYSYPSIIQGAEGKVHLVYTHQRKHIQYVEFDPDDLIIA